MSGFTKLETYKLLFVVLKWKIQKKKRISAGYLDKAVEAYTRGFECEPIDYYPGVNAISLLLQKGTVEALKEAERLTPLVSFAVARKGGASSSDYWDTATVLELAMIGRDEKVALSVLPRVLVNAEASWMIKTTADYLEMLKDLRTEKEDTGGLEEVISELREREKEIK